MRARFLGLFVNDGLYSEGLHVYIFLFITPPGDRNPGQKNVELP
jgi:hypothetical protein